MKPEDLEKQVIAEKYQHLTDAELSSYDARTLSVAAQALADAHLRICLLCEKRLEQLSAKRVTAEDRQVTSEDIAMVRRMMQERGLGRPSAQSKSSDATTDAAVQEHFVDDLSQLVKSWKFFYGQPEFVQATHRGDEPKWEWKSNDGRMQAYTELEADGGLTIHLSSDNLRLEGKRFRVSLGAMNRVIELEQISESKVGAKVTVSLRQRPRKLLEITVEAV